MLFGKLDQFVDEFLVLTVQVDFIDQFADPPRGPHFFHKAVRIADRVRRPASALSVNVSGFSPFLPESVSLTGPDFL